MTFNMASINIPYRCPNCGDSEKFTTLQELHAHLQIDHAFPVFRSQRQFGHSSISLGDIAEHKLPHLTSLLGLYSADAKKLEESLIKSKEEELNNKRIRNEHERLISSTINMPYRTTCGSSPKTSFREYGHSCRLNKHLYLKKCISADKNRYENPYQPLHVRDLEDSESRYFLEINKRSSEQMSQESVPVKTLHSSSVIRAFRDQHLHVPQNKVTGEKHVIDALNALSHDVLLERASQHAVANSLYTTQEVLSGIEQAAEEKIAQQQLVIDALVQELKDKEKRLANVMHEMESLQAQQSDSMEQLNLLKQKYIQENKQLHHGLQQKQMELDSLSKQITETKESAVKDTKIIFQVPERLSSSETVKKSKPNNDTVYSAFLPHFHIHNSSENIQNEYVAETLQQDRISLGESSTKEKELTTIRNKAQQLEKDRQDLLMEMQNLLETAATDNNKLRIELDSQAQKLSQLNCDLEQTKREQTELLDETRALYKQADVSLSTLKIMLRERDQQLICTSGSLEQAKTHQEKLARERDECLRLAEEREGIYKSLLAANTSQVNSIKDILESNQAEKLKLEKGLYELRGKFAAKEEKDKQLTDKISQLQTVLAEKERTQVELKNKIRRREEKLKKAKSEMERVTNYLKTTAEKEHESRSRLESFISGLLDRAEKAEAELQKLKSNQVPGYFQSFLKQDEVPTLTHLPGGDSKAFLQGKINNHSWHSGGKAVRSTIEMDQHIFNTSRLPDKINIQAMNRRAKLVLNQNQFSSQHCTGQHYYMRQQSPDVNISGHSVHPETSLSPSSFQHSHLIFDNTPEVERMIYSVNRLPVSEPADLLYPQKGPKTVGGRPKQHVSTHREQDSMDLSVDDNGIMWEQVSPLSSRDANLKIKHPLLRQSVEHLKINDDTDIDEDLTDYLREDEQMSHEESEEAENVLSTLKGTSTNKITKVKMAALQKDPLPFSEKMAKLPSSVEPERSMASAMQNKSKNVNPCYLQRSKLHFEEEQNKTLQIIELSPLKAANDYSTTESSETSPLIRARDVQKRVKRLTSLNSNYSVVTPSSKLSDGFEASHFERESDFSSSSYASFGQFRNSSKEKNIKLHTKDGNCKVSAIKDPGPYVLNNSTVDVNEDKIKPFIQESISKELKDSAEEHVTPTCKNDLGHTEKNLPISHVTGSSIVLIDDKFIEQQPTTIRHGDSKESVNSLEDHVSAEDAPSLVLHGQELAKYTDAEIRPAKELRARFMSQNETQTTSSEDDLLDNSVFYQSLHKKYGDASTDTDLEKLAMPGHLQKGFVVRKNMPNPKRIIRKMSRPKVPIKKCPLQEFISSDPDELEDAQKTKRQAIRKMRVALFRVFSYLDTRSLLKVSCVCKEWYRLSHHPALWRYVCLENSSISSHFLITLSKWCTQTRSLSLTGLRGRGIIAEESPEDYQIAVRGSLESGLETFLSTCHDSITAIQIIDCDNILTDKCLWLVSGYCRLLTTLAYQSSIDPITPQLMWALGGGCPGITSLLVQPKHPCEKTNAMNNRCLLLIGQLYPDILELGLGGKEFDRAGLVPLVRSCQRLHTLHFDHCLGITADVTSALCKEGLKHLQTLTISGTFIEAKAIQQFKESCRQLKRIHVSVNIQDCVDDPSKKKNKEVYKKMVNGLEALKAKSGFGIILTIKALPVD